MGFNRDLTSKKLEVPRLGSTFRQRGEFHGSSIHVPTPSPLAGRKNSNQTIENPRSKPTPHIIALSIEAPHPMAPHLNFALTVNPIFPDLTAGKKLTVCPTSTSIRCGLHSLHVWISIESRALCLHYKHFPFLSFRLSFLDSTHSSDRPALDSSTQG